VHRFPSNVMRPWSPSTAVALLFAFSFPGALHAPAPHDGAATALPSWSLAAWAAGAVALLLPAGRAAERDTRPAPVQAPAAARA
jgi:hypothetical protein